MPPEASAKSPVRPGIWFLLAWALIAASVVLRFLIPQPVELWEDEIIAVTHAGEPLWRVIVSTVRYDVHPPLYFLQLHFWNLISHADTWLLLNSVAWSIAAIASVWWTFNRLYGRNIALAATLLFAVSPVSIYMATDLRMYAMLSALIVWAFYFSVRSFGAETRPLRYPVWLTLICVAIVSTHAVGALAVLTNGLFALHLAFERADRKRALWQWVIVYGIAVFFAVPWLVNAMLHDANLSTAVSLDAIETWLGTMALGQVYAFPALIIVGAIVYLIVTLCGLVWRRTRAMTLAFLVVPPVLALACSLTSKPIFKWNIFSTAASPFMALVLARLLADETAGSLRRAMVAICALVFFATAVVIHTQGRSSTQYREMANAIRANYRAGDIVFVPQLSYFWGTSRYLAGPEWGSPLVIAPAPNSQWQKVYAKLGPRIVGLLELMPKTQMLTANGVRILAGVDAAPQAASANRVWMPMLPRADIPREYPPEHLGALKRQWIKSFGASELVLYARAP